MINDLSKEILTVIVLILTSLAAREVLIKVGQRWVATFAHTATLTTLPIITFVVTKVISGNIALSLGMIGALSIVRFRNPVKSPFELSVYFAAITMGIAASVSVDWLLFFILALFLALIFLALLEKFMPALTNTPYFETSFSEGNRLSTLEVSASSPIEQLSDSAFLISQVKDESGYSYILASDKFAELQNLMNDIEQKESVTHIQLNK